MVYNFKHRLGQQSSNLPPPQSHLQTFHTSSYRTTTANHLVFSTAISTVYVDDTMDDHLSQQNAHHTSNDDNNEPHADTITTSAEVDTEQSPGYLFVSQALLKQKPQIHHPARASTKHSLDVPDASDISFAPLNPAAHLSAKINKRKLPGFSRPASAPDDALRPHEESVRARPERISNRDGYVCL